MNVLGIETSCDETAVAVVNDRREILSNVIFSQIAEHQPYGGVVPEIAARSHIRKVEPVLDAALKDSGLTLADLDAIAVTAGPGLIGGVIVGVMTAKALALAADKPIVAINHLEGHALTARLTDNVAFPYLLLLASGGHCQFLIVEGVGKYTRLGGTVDDALGEAFDKTSKLLGMGYPGGPAVEAAAKKGDENSYKFTAPMKGRAGCDFSFSGLKTAVREAVVMRTYSQPLSEQQKFDICASFQRVATDCVIDRLKNAIALFREQCPDGSRLVVAGGVAANQYLGSRLRQSAEENAMTLTVPPPKLCTDNGAMIAWAGLERLREHGADALDFDAKARWPLA